MIAFPTIAFPTIAFPATVFPATVFPAIGPYPIVDGVGRRSTPSQCSPRAL